MTTKDIGPLTPYERELIDYIILRYGRGGFMVPITKREVATAMGRKEEPTNLTGKGYAKFRMGSSYLYLTDKAFIKENENGHE